MNNSITYNGNVTLTLIANGKQIDIHKCNSGLPDLWQNIAKYLAGNYRGVVTAPTHIDIRFQNGINWVSILKEGLQPTLDGKVVTPIISSSGALEGYRTTFNATLTYEMLSNLISGSEEYRIYLISKGNDVFNNYVEYNYAYVTISAEDLQKLTPGTQTIINWDLEIRNGDVE